MARNIPVLYSNQDSLLHRRDARVKIMLFFLLFVFLFIAPDWEWLLIPTVVGVTLAFIARTPWKWLLLFWAIHIPSFLVILGVPAYEQLRAESFEFSEGLQSGVRLVLAWTAAIVVSLSLFSTMRPQDIQRGLRGLHFPASVALSVGLTYRLVYVTVAEAMDIKDAMRLKGIFLNPRQPLCFVRNLVKMSLPLLFSVLRKAPMLMAALEMRGLDIRAPDRKLDFADGAFLVSAFILVSLAAVERFTAFSFS